MNTVVRHGNAIKPTTSVAAALCIHHLYDRSHDGVSQVRIHVRQLMRFQRGQCDQQVDQRHPGALLQCLEYREPVLGLLLFIVFALPVQIIPIVYDVMRRHGFTGKR
jgi:hypothetical protein